MGVSTWAGGAARLAALTMATLVLHGVEDRLVHPANAEVLGRSIPGAQVRMIEGASHVFFSDQPAESARLLREFLDEQDQAATG
jgi:3-oxoadipate enol-lactonase